MNNVIKILVDELSMIYCDNCKNQGHYFCGDECLCDGCNHKQINWEISDEFANEIATKILAVKQ